MKRKLHHYSKQAMTKWFHVRGKGNSIILANYPQAREFIWKGNYIIFPNKSWPCDFILVEKQIPSFFQTTHNQGNSFEKEITSFFQTSHYQVISFKWKRKFHHSSKLPITKGILLKRKLHHSYKQVMSKWFHFNGKANYFILPNKSWPSEFI